MIDRRRAMLGVAAWAVAGAAGAGPKAPSKGPRMDLGRSLDGVWTLGSYTSFQRPDELHWLSLTPAEAEAFEAPRRRLHGAISGTWTYSGLPGASGSFSGKRQ